jgi:hypothetical protein
VDEFKKIHQSDKVDEFIQLYEHVRAQVMTNQYTNEKYNLLDFLSGLRDKISILYGPTTLK